MKKSLITFLLITITFCLCAGSISAQTQNNEEFSIENADSYLIQTGISTDELTMMKDNLKLQMLKTFNEADISSDDLEYKGSSDKIVAIPNKNPNSRNIPVNRLKFHTYSFSNPQMGRSEVFTMFEWLVLPFDQLLNNDSFSFAIDDGWNILEKSEALKLYLSNDELYYKFSRPSNGSKNGSTYRISDGTLREFRGIQYGIAHFSLRPNYQIPMSDMSNYMELHYVQDSSPTNNLSYSILIGPGTLSINGGNPSIHEAFYRTHFNI